MLRLHPQGTRLGALLTGLAAIMLSVAVPVAAALDTSSVETDTVDASALETDTVDASALETAAPVESEPLLTADPVLEPEPLPTPLPEPIDVVDDLKKTVEKTVGTLESTVKETLDPASTEEPPSDDPKDPGDPADPSDPSEPGDPSVPPPPGTDGGAVQLPTGSGGVTAPGPSTDEVSGLLPARGSLLPDLPTSQVGDAAAVVGQGLDAAAAQLGDAADQPDAVGARWDDELPTWWWGPLDEPGMPELGPPWIGVFSPHGGARSTTDIMAMLDAAGLSLEEIAHILAPFPVAGPANYSADFGAPRDGGARSHAGTDVFAEQGTPVIASADGRVTRMQTGSLLGGTTLRLTEPDGTYYYYAHLAGFAPGITEGSTVTKGTVLGYVGNTGNAISTPPHLHFQIHPGGGAPVDPVPFLDRWLTEARQEARSLQMAGQAVSIPRAQLDMTTPPAVTETRPRAFAGMSGDPVTQELGVGVLVAIALAIVLAVAHGIPAIAAPYRPS